MKDETDIQTPDEALEMAKKSRAAAADAGKKPLVYHLALPAIVGCLIASFALRDGLQLAVTAATMALLALVLWRVRKRGVWVGNLRGAVSYLLASLLIVLTLAAMFAIFWLKRTYGLDWPAAAIGAALFPVMVAMSLVWEKLRHRDLTGKMS
ncbi:MAG: hypothetical protein GC155_10765 [Alphaproteobacteria bacterium]|nr:hypothetical protein [Alphaproteobacteria bacterium]